MRFALRTLCLSDFEQRDREPRSSVRPARVLICEMSLSFSTAEGRSPSFPIEFALGAPGQAARALAPAWLLLRIFTLRSLNAKKMH